VTTHKSDFVVPTVDLASALLAEREVSPRAQLIANRLMELLPGAAAAIYVVDRESGAFAAKATAGDLRVAAKLDCVTGIPARATAHRVVVVHEGRELRREDYAHLDVRRTVTSLAYAPLLADDTVLGVMEVVNYDEPFPKSGPATLVEIAEIAAPAIAAAVAYEDERNSLLHSVSRVTQMYDLEKVFNSTLEIHPLLQLIADKFQEVMKVQAVNVWMVDGDMVKLINRSGHDPTVKLESTEGPGDGIAGDLSDNGEPVSINDPEDERLRRRNSGHGDRQVSSLLAAPLMDRESLVGAVEVINRHDGLPFDEDDQFLLTSICETASNALHNASLLQTERKVEILETLVKVSHEITSTLDMDRVLHAVVDGARSVAAYDRAAIALEQRGSLVLKVVSGMTSINTSDPTIKLLKEMLEWASLSREEIHVTQRGDEINVSREASRAKFREYFEVTGARAFYALPLDDDQGRLGLLSFESRDAEFLTQAHLEVIRVLAAQTTVALRNASLYREVPFIGLLQPVLERKRKFLALEKRRQAALITTAAAALIFLVAFPVPMRLAGNASVRPAHRAQVMPAVEGVVKAVHVHEGDPVLAGIVLADLEDWDARSAVAVAQAKYEGVLAEMNRALATNDGTEAGVQRVQSDYWAAELKRAQERLDQTHLRAPIAGVVATPNVENSAGRNLKIGDTFAEVIDSAQSSVDVAIEEKDVALVAVGQPATIKLDSFPARTFHGNVEIVSPIGGMDKDERVFFARVLVANAEGIIRPGMQGRGKVKAGWRPAGYVLFRRPAMWIYSKLWSWWGW